MSPKSACAVVAGLLLPACLALAADPPATTAKQLVIGVSVPTLDHPMFAQMREAAEAEAAQLGVKVEIADAHWSADRQAMDLERMVDQKVSGILYSPVAAALLSEALDGAVAAGIPVVQVQGGKAPEKVLGAFGADEVSGGRMLAQLVIQRLRGQGVVVELVGMGPSWNAVRASFEEELRTSRVKPFVAEPIEIQRGMAQQRIAALLREGRRFDAVVAVNDLLALGAADALRAAGVDPGSKVIVGLDASPEGRRAVEQGVLTATFDPRTGDQTRLGLRCLVDLIQRGKKPVTRDVLLPPRMITRATTGG
jgi:ABC-type sugar transport system substrate-binding protein